MDDLGLAQDQCHYCPGRQWGVKRLQLRHLPWWMSDAARTGRQTRPHSFLLAQSAYTMMEK
jgi:hypothetical protein